MSRKQLLATDVSTKVNSIGVIRHPGDICRVITAAITKSTGGRRLCINSFQRSDPGGSGSYIEVGSVGCDLCGYGGLKVRYGGARQIAVRMGVSVTYPQNYVFLAGILNRVIPIGDDRKSIQPLFFGVPVCCMRWGRRTVFRYVALVAKITECSVIQFADWVVALVVEISKLAKLVQVVDNAAIAN
ncbi:hypothetical protein B597_015925 [Stutzerimonas stutzeri KOS6]|uniref:Uncharacterized protein n=1 Tax=Stutzerimonas stutzeri KOS6 TaxID=1218352 RepID=A0A061JKM1_STUST|nr:hypothetical protein B597_015925 [Stutzerimonas stutzeri KOS6]